MARSVADQAGNHEECMPSPPATTNPSLSGSVPGGTSKAAPRAPTPPALQSLGNPIVRKHFAGVRVALDVENYRQRRESQLRDMATKVAARVAQTNRSITLEPMSPADRRIIHTSLTDHPGVATESSGEGEGRKVTIMPKRD